MAFKRKRSSKKIYIAILLLVVLIVAVAAVIYATQPAPVKVVMGVHAGDSFTYGITGRSILTGLDAVETPGFSQYNQTDYYKITITDVNGSSVSLDTLWRFLNGTEVTGKQIIDLSNGLKNDPNGFWAIYASNLNVGDLLRPTGTDGVTVNKTETKTYADITRERNFFSLGSEFFDVNDPTRNTLRYDYTVVYFDKQTGMLENLTWITDYNKPEKREVITWQLISSSVWDV